MTLRLQLPRNRGRRKPNQKQRHEEKHGLKSLSSRRTQFLLQTDPHPVHRRPQRQGQLHRSGIFGRRKKRSVKQVRKKIQKVTQQLNCLRLMTSRVMMMLIGLACRRRLALRFPPWQRCLLVQTDTSTGCIDTLGHLE